MIDHPIFKRLRFIRQLALTEFLYPGAVHTRFEHSLGVMQVASNAFDSIATKHADLLKYEISKVTGFKKNPLEKAKQVLRLAALLHDVGHGSFSHAAEEAIFGKSSHEKFSVKIIKDKKYLGALIDRLFWTGCASIVAQIIDGGPDLPPQLKFLNNLVSSNMDADRTDYLLRDSHHCGVSYGKFDQNRMIECLDLYNNEIFGQLEIALNRDGIHTFEALIIARYQMNTQVYLHRVRRIYDTYLIKYYKSLEDLPEGEEGILKHNDISMMAKILHDADSANGDQMKWARRIKERDHHKTIFETGVDLDIIHFQRFKNLAREIAARFPEIDFLEDRSEAKIHDVLIEGDHDDKGFKSLKLVTPGGVKEIGEESQIIKKIPRRYLQGRIFGDVKNESEEVRKEIVKYANDKWHSLGGH